LGEQLLLATDAYQPAPTRTRGLRANELGEKDAEFSRALQLFEAAGEDIGRLWVVFECVRDAVGHRALGAVCKASKREIAALCEAVSDWEILERAAMSPVRRPPMSGRDARALVRRLLNGWLDHDNGPAEPEAAPAETGALAQT